ncbi:hypothetical protein [Tepidibacter formicigenes]|jgi:uncharacterized Zn ribbon protein|uniref:Sporulation membrane protein YtrI C-terminal domain-containing protein n=1 Tax=Tepidibacter formicigenes DSM 15518 TaxID=1123349 RepID=A0A1M6SG07_9FIRM|nr:hypothetical protein [Tepidibacter formicigenes]SHK43487.1 hypothetical protein SAMN02744037_02336 [Tepidibacter formicigenes DSM 15518]
MDILKSSKFKYILFLLTGIISGYILGVISINTLISYRIDRYYEEITYLNTIIEEKDVRLQKLEEAINNKKFIVKDIEIILLYKGDEIEKLKLKKHIREKYNILLGKEIKSIDIDLVPEIIDKRIMKIENKEYKLTVNKLMLSEMLKLWIKVEILD